jgi:sec-independent protein translocase protein TatC
MQISIATGVIISMPIWLYQLWAFLAPGLYKRERRWAYYFVGAAVPLFGIGATIAYFAMTRGLRFLVHYMLPSDVTALITINTYLSYAGAMLLIFGIAFELPLVLVLLNLAGVLTHARFRKWRRVIIFLVFAFAAIFTPSPDPISMLLLAIPCVVLTEAAEVFVWANDRRRAKSGSLQFPGLTDEQVAEYGLDKPLGEQASAKK